MLIRIEALKSICGLSVFRDYQRLEEFNVRKLQQSFTRSSDSLDEQNEVQTIKSEAPGGVADDS